MENGGENNGKKRFPHEEFLLDVQAPIAGAKVSAAEQHVIDILTKTVIGATLAFYSIGELVREMKKANLPRP